MYGIVLDESTGLDAEQFTHALAEKGVQTRPFFLGMHEQPVFQRMGLFKNEQYPVTERIARQGLYLPSGLALSSEQLEQTVKAICEVLT
jgi:perosamine synthetase